MTIKVRYIFVDRKETEVEFEDGDVVAKFIIDDRRKEENANRNARRHNYSLDAIIFEGLDFQDSEYVSPEEMIIEREKEREIVDWSKNLTETQRRRLIMRLQGMSIREISEVEGVSHQRIAATLKQIAKKIY